MSCLLFAGMLYISNVTAYAERSEERSGMQGESQHTDHRQQYDVRLQPLRLHK